MPTSCCIPGCKSNYYGNQKYVPIFRFPTDDARKHLWLRKIQRKNFTVTKNSGVCINHFLEDDILREIRATRVDGTELVLARKKLELTKCAVPSLFPSLPKRLSGTRECPRTDSRKKGTEFVLPRKTKHFSGTRKCPPRNSRKKDKSQTCQENKRLLKGTEFVLPRKTKHFSGTRKRPRRNSRKKDKSQTCQENERLLKGPEVMEYSTTIKSEPQSTEELGDSGSFIQLFDADCVKSEFVSDEVTYTDVMMRVPSEVEFDPAWLAIKSEFEAEEDPVSVESED